MLRGGVTEVGLITYGSAYSKDHAHSGKCSRSHAATVLDLLTSALG